MSKTTKKVTLLVTVIILLLGLSTCTLAESNISIVINGGEVNFNLPPILDNNTVLVPMRPFFEALNAKVNWDDSTKTITATRNNVNIKLIIGSNTAFVNNTEKTLSIPAKLINGNTYVPLRFIGEALGDKVIYENGKITIQSSATETQTMPTLGEAVVSKHIDGDTVYVKFPDGREEKVRFIGINTPESTTEHEPYGEEASNYTKEQILGKTVYLEKDVSETDKYGRLLRYIWLGKPTAITEDEIRTKMFNAILVLNGYAQVATYPPDVKYTDYFIKYQNEAREADKGLWGLNEVNTITTNPTTPTVPTDTNTGVVSGSITVLEYTKSVARGQDASITIQGVPGTTYTIEVVYSSGPSKAKGLEPKTAGTDGKVTWTWQIGTSTKLGNYPIYISGGKEKITANFTVVE